LQWKTIDRCLGRIVRAVKDAEGTLIVTADHGMPNRCGMPKRMRHTRRTPAILCRSFW
jgi:bisphosphoglycerate-independent phosphoglycerate mutase (AlkP superfamily)